MARRAMAVYDRATRAVLPCERRSVFEVSINRAAELYGVTHTRPIYERAIEVGGGDLGGREASPTCGAAVGPIAHLWGSRGSHR